MPHLKFTRDRRGYENTFLVHAQRGRGRDGQQILYWFRSPPHVKVGRAAIDEDAIRELQAQYPDIDFDWDRILQAKPPAPEPEEQARARGRGRDRRRDPARVRDSRQEPEDRRDPDAERGPEPVPELESEPDAWAAPIDAESQVDSESQAEDSSPMAEAPPGRARDSVSAVEQAFGSEGLSRLRARYAEVLARIHAAPIDAETQARLIELAEQLNPDAWVTPAQVQEQVGRFEAVLAEISAVIGPPRRRTRRGGRRTRRRREQGESSGSQAPATDKASDDPGHGEGGEPA